jgi:hypothetical protein
MSYDLFIVDKDVPEPEWFDVCERDGEHVRTAHGHYFNYTYNLSAFFTDYKVHPKHDLDGLTAGEAAARIDKALKDICLEPLYVLRGKYNPPKLLGQRGQRHRMVETDIRLLPGTPGLYREGTLLRGNDGR